jgi:Holliday junction resolvase-like predicted endonuclease
MFLLFTDSLKILFGMFSEIEILFSLLKTTINKCSSIENLIEQTGKNNSTIKKVLKKNLEITSKQNMNIIILNTKQRIKIALKLIKSGVDVKKVCSFLTWQEFEDFSKYVFEKNDFFCNKHYRFELSNRRWEIDILAVKKPIVVAVDCKQWKKGWRGVASQRAAEKQIERAKKLSKYYTFTEKKNKVHDWNHVYFVPAILSLIPSNARYFKKVPIVPILQLQDFLTYLPSYIQDILHFKIELIK